jgi:hypothetical protein
VPNFASAIDRRVDRGRIVAPSEAVAVECVLAGEQLRHDAAFGALPWHVDDGEVLVARAVDD